MDSVPNYQQLFFTTTMTVLCILLFKFLIVKKINRKSSRNRAPEPKGAWPIIGHIPLLRGSDLPHVAVGNLADKYGPIFSFRIGFKPAIVVSSMEVAKEIYGHNDRVWSSRPTRIAMKHMGYDTAMYAFSPYGQYWRELRKMVKQEFLSNSRLELIKHVWDSEINTSVNELYKNIVTGGSAGGLVDMKKWFEVFTLNTSVRVIAGKRYFGNTCGPSDQLVGDNAVSKRYQKALKEFFRLMAVFVPSDAIPFLQGWIDFGGYEREMKKTGKDLDCIVSEWLEEHKMKRKQRISVSGDNYQEKKEAAGDFMDVMLSAFERNSMKVTDQDFDADTITKATCLQLILAGSDSTMVTLLWALSLLINHPHMLKKAHDEMDIHVGKQRQVNDSDIKNLVFLRAIIKETMRLYPAAPLSTRKSIEDSTIAGYHIPSGTQLVLNISKIQRDPRVWSNPSEFKPERFCMGGEHVDVDVRGQNFELMPFGMGRRSCPGSSLALQVVHLALARLIHGFEFKTPSGAPTDMTESIGLTNVKATPLDVMITPRLPSDLYTC
ncbi:hypothetical protein MKX01_037072 [Papaver californicum]|nr:hypothetical protein MKX01_037072 [Papaver californicum]